MVSRSCWKEAPPCVTGLLWWNPVMCRRAGETTLPGVTNFLLRNLDWCCTAGVLWKNPALCPMVTAKKLYLWLEGCSRETLLGVTGLQQRSPARCRRVSAHNFCMVSQGHFFCESVLAVTGLLRRKLYSVLESYSGKTFLSIEGMLPTKLSIVLLRVYSKRNSASCCRITTENLSLLLHCHYEETLISDAELPWRDSDCCCRG